MTSSSPPTPSTHLWSYRSIEHGWPESTKGFDTLDTDDPEPAFDVRAAS
jgi:hypothetical protein